MDVNENKIKNMNNIFGTFLGKSNIYIPALHKETRDTFERVSFKGNVLKKEDILSKLGSLDLSDDVKQKISTRLEMQEQIKLAGKFLSDSRLYGNKFLQNTDFSWLSKYDDIEAVEAKADIMDKYLSDKNLINSENAQKILEKGLFFASKSGCAMVANKILSNPILYENDSIIKNFTSIMSWSKEPNIAEGKFQILDKYLSSEELYENENIQNVIGKLVQKANGIFSIKLALLFLSSPELYKNEGLQKNIPNIISSATTEGKSQIVEGFLSTPELYTNEDLQESIQQILFEVKTPEELTYSSKLLGFINSGEISPLLAVNLVKSAEQIRYKQVKKLREVIPQKLFAKIALSPNDLVVASSLIDLYGINNLSEIPHSKKRNVLRALVQNNAQLFVLSDDLKQAFPLVPKNRQEYCALLPTLVKSLGIETKQLSDDEVAKFNSDVMNLADSISKLSEDEFHNLELTLSYTKDDFIQDTLAIVESLSAAERQKVFDYFGFDIKTNDKSEIGYSLQGYPVNIHNGEKLSQINDDKTKEVIEQLRPKVIKFSENNILSCNNSNLEKNLNDILVALPELNTTIGRKQHGKHKYDIFKHSLKVMQKIVQNPQFNALNESDKKVMLLASLFHDITKAEGKPDANHANECSFDAFYIAKKFNLSMNEQSTLYKLIDTHEWLKYVNQKNITDVDRTQRLQSVAFDLQNGNIFELSKIFTQADIKAISKNDGLYNLFGDALEKYSKKIDEYIFELKKTKPILPISKLPKSSDIKKQITQINEDSSTNIKGVYVQDGIVIVKYNEIENWEKLGFSKGSTSNGIEIINPIDGNKINTGTIKFIAHGLDEANQMSNFNAFNLPDSDALLSVSYMERPESKYRLYRTQGLLLDVDSNNIYGGGENDSGSGYKKSISDFKLNYIFGGERQCDRNYISDLIKDALSLNDEEYIDFVEINSHKSMNDIEPIALRDKLIKCFSLINSNIRLGNREYNEMYVSNPTVQGVYAYSAEDEIGNISDFVSKQPQFLKDYAKQNDLPFFVFGN